MSGRFAITGARLFDGEKWHDEAALVVSGDAVEGIEHAGLRDALMGEVAAWLKVRSEAGAKVRAA